MTVMVERQLRTDLSDLVRARRAELGLSLRALAQRCVDPDTGRIEWNHNAIDRLEKVEPVTPPQLPELRALAVGLGYPLRRVQDAAGAQFLGISPVPVTHSGDLQALIQNAERLSPRDLQRLAAIAETLRSTSADAKE